MNTNQSVEQPGGNADLGSQVRKRMIQVVIQTVMIAAILFASAGSVRWVWVWVYLGVGVVILLANALVLPRELIAERGAARENVKTWDKVITGVMIIPTLGTLVVAGLDERFEWSPELPLSVHLAGLAVMVLGQALFTWAMVSNKFFSTRVRLQLERSHAVATSGPYRWVRHPGYVGYITFSVATPLIFGSLWGLVPAGILSLLMVVRTAFEDRTLQEELEGYREYAQQVRYRLLPGLW
jgi:protein-S-isoprenylcysteine O-methyltransferase Ste14